MKIEAVSIIALGSVAFLAITIAEATAKAAAKHAARARQLDSTGNQTDRDNAGGAEDRSILYTGGEVGAYLVAGVAAISAAVVACDLAVKVAAKVAEKL